MKLPGRMPGQLFCLVLDVNARAASLLERMILGKTSFFSYFLKNPAFFCMLKGDALDASCKNMEYNEENGVEPLLLAHFAEVLKLFKGFQGGISRRIYAFFEIK